jgi:hypothetical protein
LQTATACPSDSDDEDGPTLSSMVTPQQLQDILLQITKQENLSDAVQSLKEEAKQPSVSSPSLEPSGQSLPVVQRGVQQSKVSTDVCRKA